VDWFIESPSQRIGSAAASRFGATSLIGTFYAFASEDKNALPINGCGLSLDRRNSK
jgi:hypothetical protein